MFLYLKNDLRGSWLYWFTRKLASDQDRFRYKQGPGKRSIPPGIQVSFFKWHDIISIIRMLLSGKVYLYGNLQSVG